MKYSIFKVSIFFTFFLIGSSFYVDDIFGEEVASTVIISEPTLKITEYIPQYEVPELKFQVTNYGPNEITINKIIMTDLSTEKNFFASKDISIDSFEIFKEQLPKIIKVEESKEFPFELGKENIHFDEGTISGKLHVVGSGFEIITKDVSVVYVTNPGIIILFISIGIGLSFLVGYLFFRKEVNEKITKSISDDNEIIQHINKHMEEINLKRYNFDINIWKQAKNLFEEKGWKLRFNSDIKTKSEDVQWFESTYIFLQRKYLETLPKSNTGLNFPIIPIVKYTDIEIKRRISKELKNFWKNNLNIRKGIYFGTASIISSLSAILVAEIFVGYFVYNIVLALVTGFVIYRAQDFQKIFKRE